MNNYKYIEDNYPNYFPIKIIGVNTDYFSQQIIDLLQSLNITFDKDIQVSFSKKNKYISLTISVYILSSDYFSYVYTSISNHDSVKFVM